VTSGRSLAISSLAVGQASARGSTAPRTANADSKHIWRVRLGTGQLQMKLLLSGYGRSDGRPAMTELQPQEVSI
jgi:hypothetical protein